jgi:hypothetical protein
MAFLARKVNGPFWANAADPALWKAPEFPFSLLTDLVDRHGGGVSVWQVDNARDPNLRRIVAALLAGTKSAPGNNIPSLEFRLVERAKIAALGIAITQTDGGTRDAAINHLHYELSDLTSTRAVALLRLMRTKVKLVPATEAARFISQSIIQNHLPPEVLSRDFLHQLHQKKAVKIIVPKK